MDGQLFHIRSRLNSEEFTAHLLYFFLFKFFQFSLLLLFFWFCFISLAAAYFYDLVIFSSFLAAVRSGNRTVCFFHFTFSILHSCVSLEYLNQIQKVHLFFCIENIYLS